MNLYETTYDGRSLSTYSAKSGRLSRLTWFAFLSLLVLTAWSAPTFAQRRRDERAPRPTTTTATTSTTVADTQTGNPVVIGTSAQTVQIPGRLNVGNGRMEVLSSAIGGGVLATNLYIRQLNQTGSPAHLCWKVAPDGVPGLLLTTCTTSQSSLRYKTDLRPFMGGLNLITRLKPYDFAWKTGGVREIGLIAEDVAEVEPLLTFKNSKDEIEGVKYENLNVVFINAFKEQQAQIDELRKMVKTQQELLKHQAQQIDSLKKLASP
jgi:Na+-transporting methylmalonyl-CoA/oxaloacetate decarboxylase gamma subunit